MIYRINMMISLKAFVYASLYRKGRMFKKILVILLILSENLKIFFGPLRIRLARRVKKLQFRI